MGIAAKWFSSIQVVANGRKDNQNKTFMLGHGTAPLTLLAM